MNNQTTICSAGRARDSNLGFDVELVIEMSVDFLVLSVFLQQSPQDSHTPHPQFLDGHTGVGRTFALTGARVTALSVVEEMKYTN